MMKGIQMDLVPFRKKRPLSLELDAIAALILNTQRENGEIPWFDGEKTDPWDHTEAAMGLTIAGYHAAARRAFDWLCARQLDDGSWYAAYRNSIPIDKTRDTNMTTYVAVGAWHHYLITGDKSFLERMWPTIRRAIQFAVQMQGPGGEIYWAKSPAGKMDRMALLTGSSSVFMSLKCALAIAREMGHRMPGWETALKNLRQAILHHPYLFNMTKARFSMDWFYPVLTGVATGPEAQKRIDKFWKKFVIEGQGVRCVSDEPWVTIAETCELVLALAAMGNTNIAHIVFSWIQDKKFEDGTCWCGYTFPDITLWPEDKITWTNGVFLMAADALYQLTPACSLFSHAAWQAYDL